MCIVEQFLIGFLKVYKCSVLLIVICELLVFEDICVVIFGFIIFSCLVGIVVNCNYQQRMIFFCIIYVVVFFYNDDKFLCYGFKYLINV